MRPTCTWKRRRRVKMFYLSSLWVFCVCCCICSFGNWCNLQRAQMTRHRCRPSRRRRCTSTIPRRRRQPIIRCRLSSRHSSTATPTTVTRAPITAIMTAPRSITIRRPRRPTAKTPMPIVALRSYTTYLSVSSSLPATVCISPSLSLSLFHLRVWIIYTAHDYRVICSAGSIKKNEFGDNSHRLKNSVQKKKNDGRGDE